MDDIGVRYKITADNSDYKTAMNQCKIATKGLNTAIKGVAKAIGAAISIKTVTTAIKKIVELGDAVDKTSQKLGMSRKAFQQWSYICERSGVSASTFETSMKRLAQEQAKAATGNKSSVEAFKKLGMSMQDIKSLKPEQMYEKVVSQLQNCTDITTRTAIATDIFGKNAGELNTILNMTNSETEALKKRAMSLGGIMSDNLVNSCKGLKDAWTDMLGAIKGLLNVFGEKLIPYIQKAVEWVTQLIVRLQQFFKIAFNIDSTISDINIADSFADLGEEIADDTKEAKKLLTTIGGFDELNILNSKDDSSNNSSSSGTSGFSIPGLNDSVNSSAIDFELPDSWKNAAEWIRDHLDGIMDTLDLLISLIPTIGALWLAWKLSPGFQEGLAGVLASCEFLQTMKSIAISVMFVIAGFDLVNKATADIAENGLNFKNGIQAGLGAILMEAGLIKGLSAIGISAGIGLMVTLPLVIGYTLTQMGLAEEEHNKKVIRDNISPELIRLAQSTALEVKIADALKYDSQDIRDLDEALKLQLTTEKEMVKVRGMLTDASISYSNEQTKLGTLQAQYNALNEEQNKTLLETGMIDAKLQGEIEALAKEIAQQKANVEESKIAYENAQQAMSDLEIASFNSKKAFWEFANQIDDVKKKSEYVAKYIKSLSNELAELKKNAKIDIEINQQVTVTQTTVGNLGPNPKLDKTIQKYATGGVVNKPTIAMVGEYSGASSNPEIITPENKMRDIFNESNNTLGEIFVQVGRQIVQAIQEQDNSVVIGDDVIAKAAARGNKNYQMRTGMSLI